MNKTSNSRYNPRYTKRRRLSSPSSVSPSNTNLGELAKLAQPLSPTGDFIPPPPSSFDPSQLHDIVIDPTAIFGSSVLLLVLLFFGFDRILGLDRVVANWTKDWRERRALQRRVEILQTREELEKQLNPQNEDSDDDDDDSSQVNDA
jgi:hypothetical protein